ncbi:SIR2 family protein [Heyndrickxia oleronia]|uniref:SIR2 family NAD-dependent protein deacylase n=1 Tax=Heyndrickxia oleronia TaxID=38875 RepID=UPI00203D2716|nr:SIR2 family protein [Heyndrickxia oleronia]MCM3239555.1 SIR2 family protein [Heyndrickxia oleronia]
MGVELVYTYINDIAKRLHDPNRYGSTSVMVGAGFSKNAISLAENAFSPNWEELAKKMYESLYPCPSDGDEREKWEKVLVKKTSGKNVLKLAEEYKVAFGRNKLDKFIEDSIGDDKFIPGDLHVKLLELNWNDVFTTNYDTLLERSIDNISVRKNYKILTSQKDLPGSTHPRIIKLHGSIPNAKPYIICEEDYRTYPVKYAPLVNTVQQSMLETQLCLLGFSGDDPNFLNWLGWLRDNMGENCPQIYLCGIFSEMSEFERKMLESQNITVVNLESLLENNSANKHYDAINRFLELLKNYGKKRNIFKEVPFRHRPLWEIDKEEYYNEMLKYTDEVNTEVSKYLVLPVNAIGDFHKQLYAHFEYVLKQENDQNKFALVSNMVVLLRKCYMPLMDHDAQQIKNLLKDYPFDKLPKDTKINNFKSMWFELVMYLAEMYRLDSNFGQYEEVMKLIEFNISHMDTQRKSEYQIERCKYYITEFNYTQALESVKKIEGDISLEMQVKKACLLSQLQMVDDALDILKKCSASVAQKSYSENKAAALTSYINLCARSLNIYGNSLNDFSDQDFTDNKYNVRKIFTENKEKLINSLFAAEYKKIGKSQAFNPNTFTITYGTTPTEVTDAFTDAFRYLLVQDNLCLSVFSDHKQLIANACTELISTSENPLWKWSYILRTDDEKIIKKFFTKERIVTASIEWTRKLFDQLILLLDSLQQKGYSHGLKQIISQKAIFVVLPRLCCVLDDDRIIRFLDKIYETMPKIDDINKNYIINALHGISYYLNSNILKANVDKVLKQSASNDIYLAGLFQGIKIDDMQNQVSHDLILSIIDEINSKEIKIRDNGLTKIVLLNESNLLSEYQDEISKAIWGQIGEFNIPKSEIYSVILWEKLPHQADVSFNEIYISYLKNPDFPRCVEGRVIHGYVNVDGVIQSYINSFYALSNFKDNNYTTFDWGNDLINTILEYIFDYLENEKRLILNHKYDIFGQGKEAQKYFSKLSELVAYVGTQASISGCYDNSVKDLVSKIKGVFQETETSILCINILEKLVNDNWQDVYKDIMKQIMSGSLDDTSQAFTALDIVVVYKKFKNQDIKIESELLDLIKSLKYMDVKNSRSILFHLSPIITREMFLTSQFKNVIISSLQDCLDIYEIAISDINKDYLDALFNLSKLAKRYYIELQKHQIQIPEEMNQLIVKLKKLPYNEVKNLW